MKAKLQQPQMTGQGVTAIGATPDDGTGCDGYWSDPR